MSHWQPGSAGVFTVFFHVTNRYLTFIGDNDSTMNTQRAQLLTQDKVQPLMDRVAELVTELPPDQWGGWVKYFLESLDAKAQANGRDYTYIDALHGIQDGVMFWLDGDAR